MWYTSVLLLLASKGDEIVSRASASLLGMYTNFCFSTAPRINVKKLVSNTYSFIFS